MPLYSPLNDRHIAAGASFTDFAGFQMPLRYTSELAEHHAVRTAAGLFDLSHMGEIVVLGPQAADVLDYALSGRLSALTVGRAKYSLLLDAAGGVLDDLVAYRTGEDRFMIVANAANRQVVADRLRERAAKFDAEIYDESGDVALIAIQGPESLGILQEVPGLAIEGGHPDGEDVADTLTALRYYHSVAALIDGNPLLIARTGYTGEDGFELYLSPEQAGPLWDSLLETGSGSGLIPAGLAARDTLRLEAGMPLYGHELTVDILPSQAGLGGVVDLSKPVDFVGRTASEEGPRPDAPILVGLAGDGKRAARAGYEVFSAGNSVGEITSGALSPTLGYPIAIAYVAAEAARTGTVVEVDVRGSRLNFTVTALPFYTRKKN
jgi:aminomethyltransferase